MKVKELIRRLKLMPMEAKEFEVKLSSDAEGNNISVLEHDCFELSREDQTLTFYPN